MDETEERAEGTDAGGDAISLDLGLCKACGICIALCPTKVFDDDDAGRPIVSRPQDCTACLLCELHCPDFAIEIRRRSQKRRTEAAAAAEHERVKTAIHGQRPRRHDEACGTHGEDD
jgi:2-oxoglutarate ferredoxin oxidoreductase subunit delta